MVFYITTFLKSISTGILILDMLQKMSRSRKSETTIHKIFDIFLQDGASQY